MDEDRGCPPTRPCGAPPRQYGAYPDCQPRGRAGDTEAARRTRDFRAREAICGRRILRSFLDVPDQPARYLGQRFLRQRQVAPPEDALPPMARHQIPRQGDGEKPGSPEDPDALLRDLDVTAWRVGILWPWPVLCPAATPTMWASSSSGCCFTPPDCRRNFLKLGSACGCMSRGASTP